MPEPISYGVCTPDQMKDLTGLEFLQAMIDGLLPAPPMAERLGFLLVEVSPGRAMFEGEPGRHLLNPLGSVHGGWALTLIDSAAGCALHTELHAGVGYTSVETKTNFTRPIRPDGGKVRAIGKLLTHGRQIATAEAQIIDEDDKILAHGTSTLIILHPRA